MLTNRTLARINNRPREVARLPLLVAGGGVLVLGALLFAFAILPPLFVLGVLGGGVLLVLLLYVTQKSKTTISLSYKGKLENETATRFSEVREALEDLASSEGIWHLPVSSKRPRAGEVAPSPEREPATVGLLPTPGIKADVPIWGIEAGDGTIFFFPEGTLLYRNDSYEPVPYKALKITFSSGRFFEEDDLPNDATVVDSIWRFSRPDGSPDPRYKNDNVEIPVVLYSLLDINGPSGLRMRLMVSNRRAAARFARTFGAEDLREKRRKGSTAGAASTSGKASERSSSNGQNGRAEPHRSAVELEREARLATARKTLGVAKGAKAEEIIAAYRELARIHHPDKVANLEPEVREFSERRMKEINSAYADLKRQWNEPATEETRAG
jgi:DnaJ-domain-containing protein 1